MGSQFASVRLVGGPADGMVLNVCQQTESIEVPMRSIGPGFQFRCMVHRYRKGTHFHADRQIDCNSVMFFDSTKTD